MHSFTVVCGCGVGSLLRWVVLGSAIYGVNCRSCSFQGGVASEDWEVVQHQKSNEKGDVEIHMDKFIKNGTTFIKKYIAWKASLEEEADV